MVLKAQKVAAGLRAQWLILGLGLLLIAALFAWHLHREHERVAENESALLVGRIRIVSSNIQEKFEATDRILQALAHPAAAALPADRRHLETLIHASPGLRNLLIIDANGKITDASRAEVIGQNVSDRPYFLQAVEHRDQDALLISPPFVSKSGFWVMTLSRIRKDERGQFAGLVTATLYTEYFRNLLDSVNYAPDMRVSLAHGIGICFMAVPESAQPHGTNLQVPGSFLEKHINSGRAESVMQGISVRDGKARLVAIQTLHTQTPPMAQPLFISASRELSAIHAIWQNDAFDVGLAYLLIVAIAVGLMLLLQHVQVLQRKKLLLAEGNYLQNERAMHSILDNLPARIGNWDKDLRNRFANKAYYEWFGIPEERMRGMHLREVLGEELYQRNKAYIDATLAGTPQVFERDVIRHDGLAYYGLVHYLPDIRDGEVDGMYVMIADITPLKAAQMALRQSEHRFRELFENAPIAYMSQNERGEIIDVNERLCEMLGQPREDLVGTPFDRLWPKNTQGAFAECFKRFLKEGRMNMEITLERKDAAPLTALIEGNVQRDGYGRFLRTHCILYDISERKLAELSLAESQSMLANMIDSAMDAIITTDEQQNILIFNRAAEAMFGYSNEEIIGTSLNKLIPSRFHAAHKVHMDHFSRSEANTSRHMGSGGGKREVVGLRADGGEFPIEASISHISYGGQQIYTVVVRDITERKQSADKLLELNERLEARVEERTLELGHAKQQAESASRTKSEFLANMSHEIRTPINSVLGMTHLAMKTPLTLKQRDYLEKIALSGNYLLGVINDILDFSKIEAGKLEIEHRAFDLNLCMEQVQLLIQERSDTKGLVFSIEIEADVPPFVEGDPHRLNQILLNLASNAIKFTAQGKVRICVSKTSTPPMLRFEVIDTGIGIDEATRHKLFQSFQQADTSTTRKYGGTGLGLAISKQLTDLMGGQIGVSSTVGVGSTFWFVLPLPACDAPPVLSEPVTHQPVNENTLRDKQILVADDHPFNQQIAQEILEAAGATVCIANNGFEVLDLLQSTPFDLILLDIQMPEMDGHATARALRARKIWETIPLIAMTANVSAADREACLASGMNDFVGKPVNPQLLLEKIMRHLDMTPDKDSSGESSSDNSSSPDMLIDLNVLASLIGPNRDRLHKFTLKFINSTQESLKSVQDCLARGDFKALMGIGHRMKSVARTVGAHKLAELFEALERETANLDAADVAVLCEKIQTHFTDICSDLVKREVVSQEEIAS